MEKKVNRIYATMSRLPFYEIALKHIKLNDKVLDIGAGNGSFAEFCKRNDFYLFDGNYQTVQELKKKNYNAFYGELPNLPFEDNFFDTIHCSHVIEHLTPETFYKTIKEINRCLKPHGYLVISAPLLWEGFYDDLSHIKPYQPWILKKYLTFGTQVNYTRDIIASDYTEIEIVYRLKESDFFEDYYNTNNSIIINLIFKLINLLYRFGLRKYIKTGYTIVLKKMGK